MLNHAYPSGTHQRTPILDFSCTLVNKTNLELETSIVSSTLQACREHGYNRTTQRQLTLDVFHCLHECDVDTDAVNLAGCTAISMYVHWHLHELPMGTQIYTTCIHKKCEKRLLAPSCLFALDNSALSGRNLIKFGI
jgi:hypothetical protein